ncbi:MAG: hypothetical protein ABIZ91_04645 [Gemmatimonadaceae bacterium]
MPIAESDSDLPLSLSGLEEGPAAAGARRERLRFTRFEFVRTPTARCTAEVELEYQSGDAVVGRAEGVATPLGDVRLAAEATLRAIEEFSRGTLKFELIGVKQMRAFDANVVIVSVGVLSAESKGARRLLGCHLAGDDPLRGAVVATLQATNRMLGNAIATR